MTFVIITLFIFLFIARRLWVRSRITALQLKPYRYQIESRRSPWANRLGF